MASCCTRTTAEPTSFSPSNSNTPSKTAPVSTIPCHTPNRPEQWEIHNELQRYINSIEEQLVHRSPGRVNPSSLQTYARRGHLCAPRPLDKLDIIYKTPSIIPINSTFLPSRKRVWAAAWCARDFAAALRERVLVRVGRGVAREGLSVPDRPLPIVRQHT